MNSRARTRASTTARLAVLVAAAVVLSASTAPPGSGPEQPVRAIVWMQPGVAIDEINLEYGTNDIAEIPEKHLYLLELPDDVDPTDFIKVIDLDERVVAAEINDDAHSPTAVAGDTQPFFFSLEPDDYPQYGTQYVHELLNLPAAHGITRGAGSIVAVLDTGVDATHEVLAGRVLDGYNFIDDSHVTADVGNGEDEDGDGYTDEMVGHGTLVAGAVALVAPEASILPVTVLDSDGNSSIFRIMQGIYWAIDHDADVINLSLGARTENVFLVEAVQYARGAGVLVISAAGNDNREHPVQMPAGDDNALGVASTDPDDQRSWFSNYGAYVDFCAPGASLISTIPDPPNGYAEVSGTSLATALVSGVAALVKARYPDATPEVVVGRLELGAVPIDDLNPGFEGLLGAGRVDAHAALGGQSGDIDRNGFVDLFDLTTVTEQWQTPVSAGGFHGDRSMEHVGYRHLVEILRGLN